MKFCVSQFRSSADVEDNIRRHAEVGEMAAAEACGFVLFPELSLTGYEPGAAQALALRPEDSRFDPLQAVADRTNITVACGAPLLGRHGVEIGLVVLRPLASRTTYAKQVLHVDEEAVFVPGRRDVSVRVGAFDVAPGICFESVQPGHIAAAVGRGAKLYAASVAKPADAMAQAHDHYAAMAKLHRIPILVSNAVGPSDGFVSGGRSAAWRADGTCLGVLSATEPDALIIEL